MKRKRKAVILAAMLMIIAVALLGCSSEEGEGSFTNTEQDTVPLTEAPPVFNIPMPTASGVNVEQNDKAIIDYSNIQDGYVVARYSESTDSKIKVIVDAPGGDSYTYSLEPDGKDGVFPLSDGNGSYVIGVYEQAAGMKYAVVVTVEVEVELVDEFAPFIRPSLYVNYDSSSAVVKKSNELMYGTAGLMDRIAAVYNYVIENITYDTELAETVQSGYIPDLDMVLRTGQGICFDYASVMTAMLRCQGIPTKLVFGYTGDAYHAWINVYSEETGWVNEVIYFDGVSWKLMDPTFASGGAGSSEIMEYIGDGTNYIAKYQY